MTAAGGCHCGAVRFHFVAPAQVKLLDCNCSMCSRTGFLHLIVAHEDFVLDSGKGALTSYRFGTGTAEHLFCRHCGIKPFYVPRSNPDGIDVNVRAFDRGSVQRLTVTPFDGEHWEQHADALRDLSRDERRDG